MTDLISGLSESFAHSAVLTSTLVVAVAEIGDKTQLLSLLLTMMREPPPPPPPL
ncbi:MAG: hypothetical protein CMH99_00755, partial [Oceanospirillaceae bacterium]|nr:hypothetical protein [Oceanospirillaceae bacterium]